MVCKISPFATRKNDSRVTVLNKIIDKFSGTPAANLSKYYAGICYLKMGDFAKAEKYLKLFF